MRKDVLIDIDYVMTLENPVVFNVLSSYGIPRDICACISKPMLTATA